MQFKPWLLGLALCACASTVSAEDQFAGTGLFLRGVAPKVGAPNYRSFVKLIKQQPNVTAVFIDYREPIASAGQYDAKWSNNAAWTARNLATLCSAPHLNRVDANGKPTIIPIVSVGLTDEPTSFQLALPTGHPDRGKYHEAKAVAMMRDVANGRYDVNDAARGKSRVWPAIFDAFRTNGFNKIYLRIGWEQNGNWYGWRVRNEATRAAYVAAWRHVADLAHSYAATHAMTIQTVWSPTASYANYGMGEEASYPGDAYVDIIGPDAYSPIWNPTPAPGGGFFDWSSRRTVTLAQWFGNAANRKRIWDHPTADYYNPNRGWGLPAALAFARAHDKPFALSETGTGNKGMTTAAGGPIDEGDYPLYVAERLSAAMREGLRLEFVDVWAELGPDGKSFLGGTRPREAAGWREALSTLAAVGGNKNTARGKRVYASSAQQPATAAGKAVDGQASTSWVTNANASQWLQVDLGKRSSVSRVRLNWAAAYAASYQIQTSLDAKAWTTVFRASAANGGVDDLVGLKASGRFVRLVAEQPAPKVKGYALREIEIYP